jgi:hypothetical protein
MKGKIELVDIQGHEGDYPGVSRLKFELIVFFKENPGVIDSAEMISNRLGRNPDEVERALDELADREICLKVSQDIISPVYAYQPSTNFLRKINEIAPDLCFNSRMELLNLFFARERG